MRDAAQQLDTANECRRHRDHAHSSLNRSRYTKGGFYHFRAFSIQTSPIVSRPPKLEVCMCFHDSKQVGERSTTHGPMASHIVFIAGESQRDHLMVRFSQTQSSAQVAGEML
jgi:hypothetical protein